MQVYAHLPELAKAASEMAKEFDQDAMRRGFKPLETEIARGSRLSFHLVLSGLNIDDPIQSLIWNGSLSTVQFAVDVPEEQKIGNLIGTVTISNDNIPLGHIKFKLTVTDMPQPDSQPKPTGLAHAYRNAFISYASQDRAEVLKRVQMLQRLKIQTFQDVLNLEPGARWEKQLYRHIDECDLFLLFWSSSASRSEWVMKEVQYAMKRKGNQEDYPPEIIPVIIEGPPPVPPPDELSHLHFNDYLLYFMRGDR